MAPAPTSRASSRSRFPDDFLNQFPDLACDGGWVYLMIGMSLERLGPPLGRPAEHPGRQRTRLIPGGPPPPTGSRRLIDEWVADAGEVADQPRRIAEIGLPPGLARPLDPRWVNDLLGIGMGGRRP